MSEILSYKNKFGSLAMERRGRIILCSHTGSLNGSLMRFFNDHLEEVIGDLKGSPWGYLSSSLEATVATQEVEDLLVESGRLGLRWGCVAAAYVLKSPVAIDQTRRVREQLGIPTPLDDILFTTEEEAFNYLTQAVQAVVDARSEK